VETREGVIHAEPVPFPVNRVTVFWEYIKMEVANERIFWGRVVQHLRKTDPANPILTRIVNPYFTDPVVHTHKQCGRRVIFFFYLPCLLIAALLVWLLYKATVKFLCNRRKIQNRHGTQPAEKQKAE